MMRFFLKHALTILVLCFLTACGGNDIVNANGDSVGEDSGDNGGGDNGGDDNSDGDNSDGDNSDGDNSGDDNSDGDNSGDDNSDGDNSGDDNSGDDNSDGDNSDGDNGDGDNSGDDNSDGDNSGDDNSGDDNSDGDNGDGDNGATASIAAVYLAQTHVLNPNDPLFKLVANRDALVKVQVVDPEAGAAPEVAANVSLNGESTTLILSGPSVLPTDFEDALGEVQHRFEDSFTATIPAAWVQPGLAIEIVAADAKAGYDVRVGAPNALRMHMFDIHYFGLGNEDYPPEVFDELQAKWPASSLSVERIRDINFKEMVIPARTDVGTKHVRVSSTDDYTIKTGLPFDGEQAALQWVGALSAANGNQDTALSYVNIIGVLAGGQAGGFNGVGYPTVGILSHELGHALSIPHVGEDPNYPYKGDMHGIPAPEQFNATHVGPTWAYDLPSKTFISPVVQETRNSVVAGTYKMSPMQGGGDGDQEAPFLLRHFSDHSVNKMQSYLENKLAVERNNSWFKWNDADGAYSREVTSGLGVRYPIDTQLQVISVMAATLLSDEDVNMVYPPIGPYTGNLIRTFNPQISEDRSDADAIYCPTNGCDFSLRITQGGATKTYMLAASGDPNADSFAPNSLNTSAVNLAAADGEVTFVELLHTPDAEKNGLPSSPTVLSRYEKENNNQGFTWKNDAIDSCTNDANGPVKVFFLAGQSNMQGYGIVSPTQQQIDKNGGKGTLSQLADTDSDFAHLRDDQGNWTVRDDVWIADLNNIGKLSVGWGVSADFIGPELQFGMHMGDLYQNQVLLIKTAWGGASLAADWRPPASGGEVGPRYEEMFARAREVLSNLENTLPGYEGQGFEIAGFAWHQGWNDRINQTYVDEYQSNLVNFINDVRQALTLPELPFALATTGMSGWDEQSYRGLLLMEAQLAAPSDSRLRHGNIAAVETRQFWRPIDDSPLDQAYHWNRNAETYFLIGQGLADAMQPLICQQ